MSAYQPISCAQHERLEFSVLRKIPLDIVYLHDGVRRNATIMPLDVETRAGAEWLTFRSVHGGDITEIRLDAIISFSEVSRP